MSGSSHFALALVLLWLAFLCFFVAFHPGGIQVNGHAAQNPADVIKYFMQKMAQGQGPLQPGSNGNSGGGTTNA